MSMAPDGMRFVGVELDRISGRIAQLLHPDQDIRIENFRDTRLPENGIDAVIGNVPFADLKLDYHGQKLSLHDYFFARSIDALRPAGVLALVTTHFTLDKQNAAIREYLAAKADFVGAIRLPSDAFKREGTTVVTDILFLRKRAPDEPARHADPDWLGVAPLAIEGVEVAINRYFLNHPEMVLGTWTRKDTLYAGEGYSVVGNGDLAGQLRDAIRQLPEFAPFQASSVRQEHHVKAFTLPPLERHISEGSFFVVDDRTICQLLDGQPVPVVYGGTTLRANGTLTGKRLAALVGLRNLARRVLQSQNEGWPEAHREEARRQLNWTYQRFDSLYGPINKTTFSETSEGTVIRRMPNLVKFREDPDAMLVMSLEDYDEVTGKAAKAAIMTKDVVGRTPPVTHVKSAEEGLLVSLNQRGAVDLPFIATLYGKPEEQIVAELGDLIFRDPESETWETADAYLSGNVRAKLAVAERTGPDYARNVETLHRVQPEDVLPGDIDANLGAPWIPEGDIQAFVAELFRVELTSVPVAHLKKDAVWSLDADYATKQSVAATSEYGTPRANGTNLFELALNMKTPVIYDINHGDREERVVNQEATMAAREKQKLIKERFRSWVFSDPERTERLVRIYNDTYNNLRPRLFDGSHLDFPGMNQTIRLRPHQKDAVWRGMSSGNTLLAHCVGAGKTYTMAATGMKMKQAGLIQKPMYVVPNHLLEQFAREFMQLYPNAKLLVAAKEDLSRDRRKHLTARIASGEWDGIIVTHSREASFDPRRLDDYLDQIARIDPGKLKQYEEATGIALARANVDFSGFQQANAEAEERRLMPRYVEEHFIKASAAVGLKVEPRADGLWRVEHVLADLRSDRLQAVRRLGKPETSYRKATFRKEHLDQDQHLDAALVGPGHPLYASVDEKLNEQLSALVGGTGIFLTEESEVPFRLHLFEVSIRGQTSKGEQQTLHGELVAVREELSGPTTGAGRFSMVPADCLLDLPPYPQPPAALGVFDSAQAADYLKGTYQMQLRSRQQEERRKFVDICRDYLTRSFEARIRAAQDRVMALRMREASQPEVGLAR
jgi:hypothetical protein